MATEKWLIDANKIRDKAIPLEGLDGDGIPYAIMAVPVDAIEVALTVDAVEVVHGHWISDKADILFHCSVCETQISTDWDYDDLSWNYCPNCGAKMDG